MRRGALPDIHARSTGATARGADSPGTARSRNTTLSNTFTRRSLFAALGLGGALFAAAAAEAATTTPSRTTTTRHHRQSGTQQSAQAQPHSHRTRRSRRSKPAQPATQAPAH